MVAQRVEDWPVAVIPSEPVAELSGGVCLPLRWQQHGDVRTIVDGEVVHLAVEDLFARAGVDAEMFGHLVDGSRSTWAKRPGAPLLDVCPVDVALRLLEVLPTPAAAELLEWLREQLPVYTAPEVVDQAIGLEGFLDAYTVAAAAEILDRDPAVSIGQQSLFRHLELIGWASRELDGQWRPTPAALRGRFLTVRDVPIHAGKTTTVHRQLYVTKTGLAELRLTLHALHPVAADVPAAETLPIPE